MRHPGLPMTPAPAQHGLATSPLLEPEWKVSVAPVGYDQAVAAMEARVGAIAAGAAGECVWLLEHPPLYTAGTSADPAELLDPRFPVHRTGRGGRFTYHGPGQRVSYVMLDLKARGACDVRGFVCALEGWVIDALASFGIRAERRPGRVGLWVAMEPCGGLPGQEAKIGAIGVRVRRWVTFHGVAINVAPDLSHFGGIVPCGIAEHGVTSMKALGVEVGMAALDAALRDGFARAFPMLDTPR